MFFRINEGGLKYFASTGGLEVQTNRFMNNLRSYGKNEMYNRSIHGPDYFEDAYKGGPPKTQKQIMQQTFDV